MPRLLIKIDPIDSQLEGLMASIVSDIISIKKAGYEVILFASAAKQLAGRSIPFEERFDVDGLNLSITKDFLRSMIRSVTWQPIIITKYLELFRNHNEAISQILLNQADLCEQSKYERIRALSLNLIYLNVIPIFSENLVFSNKEEIDAGDILAGILGTALQVDKIIVLGRVDAFFTQGPDNSKFEKCTSTTADFLFNMGPQFCFPV